MQVLVRDNPKHSIVFCNSGASVGFVQEHFQRAGIVRNSPRVVVHSDVTFKGKKQQFDCVINFDVPYAPKMYATRLQAAGADSRCISLLCDYYSDFAQPILESYPVACSWSPYALQMPSRKEMQEWSIGSLPAHHQDRSKTSKGAPAMRAGQYQRKQADSRDRDKQPAVRTGKSLWSRIAALFTHK